MSYIPRVIEVEREALVRLAAVSAELRSLAQLTGLHSSQDAIRDAIDAVDAARQYVVEWLELHDRKWLLAHLSEGVAQ